MREYKASRREKACEKIYRSSSLKLLSHWVFMLSSANLVSKVSLTELEFQPQLITC